MASISRECSPLLAGMLSSAVIVLVCLYAVFRLWARSLTGRCFIVIWISQNYNKIQIIKELLCVKYGLLSLAFFVAVT